MPGYKLLCGERADRARMMLRAVTDVLDDAGVRYWLDSGTLLGIIREQRLLPWDTDMDISLDSESVSRCVASIPELNRHGFRIRQRFHGPGMPECTRLFKIRNRKWFFLKGDLLLDAFVQYRVGDHCHWVLSKKRTELPLSAPAAFFETLDSVEFDGKRYPIPSNTEEYLHYRYGNWRVPVTRWNCFEDDKAILQAG